MKLPADSEIPLPKLLQYLLVPLARADKSKFLARAGYTTENPSVLIADIRSQILPLDATPAGTTKFGDFFEIRGTLRGPNGVSLRVKTIWIREHLQGSPDLLPCCQTSQRRHEIRAIQRRRSDLRRARAPAQARRHRQAR